MLLLRKQDSVNNKGEKMTKFKVGNKVKLKDNPYDVFEITAIYEDSEVVMLKGVGGTSGTVFDAIELDDGIRQQRQPQPKQDKTEKPKPEKTKKSKQEKIEAWMRLIEQ